MTAKSPTETLENIKKFAATSLDCADENNMNFMKDVHDTISDLISGQKALVSISIDCEKRYKKALDILIDIQNHLIVDEKGCRLSDSWRRYELVAFLNTYN